jgi:photosystem II stability/assembly factor-like uncharacterized protein
MRYFFAYLPVHFHTMIRYTLACCAVLLFFSCRRDPILQHKTTGAGEALRFWAMARTFPDGRFYTEKYSEALAQWRQYAVERNGDWEAIGPKNIGGRTLCLAVHPLDTNLLWAGSASGGLWKTTVGGKGPQAWEYVETGFPLLGVGAIALDPQNPQTIYIGAGEVYNLENSSPNVAYRTTRGTYGIGILKSTDGGQTWTKSLDWSYGDLRGVQEIRINPLRPATVYAATTEGLLRSYDAGASWQVAHNRPMAVDLEINPADTNLVFVTHGSLNDDAVSGIFRSTNGGGSFTKLGGGLPATYSGKTLVSFAPSNPSILYASVANDFTQEGLYRSNNNGGTWVKVNTSNVATYQGWYSHDVAVHPADPNTIIWVGIDAWKSVDGGTTVQKKTNWSAWFFGQVPAGGPEGPPNYVHADIHHVYFQPNEPGKVYCATDGGIFVSYDDGETWQGRNGGYQTQQFYANMGSSLQNPNLAIGGMQDNATAIYSGEPAWTRVLGGDGLCAAVNPANDQILYGSSQYLNMRRSQNGGQNWQNVTPPDAGSESRAFNGPFELAPSNPLILYAGAESLFGSGDGGTNWENISGGPLQAGSVILTIAVAPSDPFVVWCSTTPENTAQARVFKINALNGSKTAMSGLPNRMCMDIAVHPGDVNTVYAVFAGFNTPHVYKSTNGGGAWQSIDNGLPDIPANSILVDPLYPEHLYLANDIGVWLSRNGGQSWEPFSTGAPAGMLAMHLGITADRKLRVATHGLGVWQAPLAEQVGVPSTETAMQVKIFPNPARTQTVIQYRIAQHAAIRWRLFDVQGRELRQSPVWTRDVGFYEEKVDLSGLDAGQYWLRPEFKTAAGWRGKAQALVIQ